MSQQVNLFEELESEIDQERGRLSTDRMDISFGELINLYKNKELLIRPEYQRLFRWSPKQKTALIESILLSIPIPPIFVAEDKNGIWELIDGLQRVSTILSFFGELDTDVTNISYTPFASDEDDTPEDLDNMEEKKEVLGNKWTLVEGGLIKALDGYDLETLPPKYKINIKRAVCRVEILRGESNISMKYELFKRLNSGGSKLTPQEIRNAIYRGVSPKLNELILELSKNPQFKELTDLSDQKKMELYDQELILRFIAFYNNVEIVNENTENFLNDFMEKSVKDLNFKYNDYKETFNKVISNIYAIGDKKIFRNNRNLFVPAEFEGITVALAQNITQYDNNPTKIKAVIEKLKTDSNFRKVSGSASNSKSRIKARLKRANDIFKKSL